LKGKPLFEPDFLSRVAALAPGSWRRGREAGSEAGGAARGVAGFELADFRAYAPGDDPRTIDWQVLARLDEPFVRTFRDAAPPEVVFVLDRSPSMRFGTPTKDEAARRLAGAMGALAIGSGGRARIGGERRAATRPQAVAAERRRRARREWVVLSDLYDARDLAALIEPLRARGDPLTVVEIRSSEDDPPSGAELVDAETGERRILSGQDLQELARRREQFDAAWRERCARLRAPLARVRAEQPWEQALAAVLAARARGR
jgi:uncharacterized protein (DUF58 family)